MPVTPSAGARFTDDVVVVGGAGHVGLALSIAFASRGLRTVIVDINERAVDTVMQGRLPFLEQGAEPLLREALAQGLLRATTSASGISSAENVVVVTGTPVDEHLNPDPHSVPRTLEQILGHLRPGQLLILRSTIYPGVTRRVEKLLRDEGLEIDVAFCPERIAEGKAIEEIFTLPQIVSGRSAEVCARAGKLFSNLTEQIVELEPEEAELAKLFTNTWRYLKFAAANQFYVMANDHGLDFERIRHAVTYEYPRAADLPGAGFAAGPCLFKDTMQLAAFSDNSFVLGHSAMLVNEGLPLYLVSRLEAKHDLEDLTIGILGMAFKAGSDDTRSSLSYKLKRILEFKAKRVLTTDPLVTTDPELVPLDQVLAEADILVIGAPHADYRGLRPDVPVVDVWNLLGQGTTV